MILEGRLCIGNLAPNLHYYPVGIQLANRPNSLTKIFEIAVGFVHAVQHPFCLLHPRDCCSSVLKSYLRNWKRTYRSQDWAWLTLIWLLTVICDQSSRYQWKRNYCSIVTLHLCVYHAASCTSSISLTAFWTYLCKSLMSLAMVWNGILSYFNLICRRSNPFLGL